MKDEELTDEEKLDFVKSIFKDIYEIELINLYDKLGKDLKAIDAKLLDAKADEFVKKHKEEILW